MLRRAIPALVVGSLLSFPLVYGAITTQPASINNQSAKPQVPASVMGNWVDLCTDIATADNGGSSITNPSLITRAAQGTLTLNGVGTTIQYRIKYKVGTTITACTVQPFGFDTNNVPDKLADATGTHPLSFLSASDDVTDATGYSYTASQEVDANGATRIMGAIKTLATGTGASTAVLQVRVK